MRARWGVMVGGAALFAAGAAGGISVRNFKNGLYYSPYTEEERFFFEDQDGATNYTQYRGVVFVPPQYGKLLTITGGPGETLLWYEDEAGVIRNIPVESQRILAIKRQGKRSS